MRTQLLARYFLSVLSSILYWAHLALADSLCTYEDDTGVYRTAETREKVPEEYRSSARCRKQSTSTTTSSNQSSPAPRSKKEEAALRSLLIDLVKAEQDKSLRKPKDVRLFGEVQEEKVSTKLGMMQVRWSKESERYFRKSPVTTVGDVAFLISQALLHDGFAQYRRGFLSNWQIVFLSEHSLRGQVPADMIENCHPGWMTPPANIYIVADRIAGSCGAKKLGSYSTRADSMLFEVLLHEFAHAVDYRILEERFYFNRPRSEGFATWFQVYARTKSSDLREEAIALRNGLNQFALNGFRSALTGRIDKEALQYGGGSMMYFALEERFGSAVVLRVHRRMVRDLLTFQQAVEQETGWDGRELTKAMIEASGSTVEPERRIGMPKESKAKQFLSFDEAICSTMGCLQRHSR